jgi:vacuolar iron transporter family protein
MTRPQTTDTNPYSLAAWVPYFDAYLLVATQAERDQYIYLKSQFSSRILQSCTGEIEREVDDVLVPLGVPEDLSKKVAEALQKREFEFSPLAHQGRYIDEEEGSSNLRWSDEVGLTPFLLRFGRGIEPVSKGRMYSSAATIGLGYLFGGLIPLMPYFFIQPASTALIYSSILTGVVLVLFGAIKTHIVGCSGKFTDYLYGALTTLLVGGLSAAAAFGFVKLLAREE